VTSNGGQNSSANKTEKERDAFVYFKQQERRIGPKTGMADDRDAGAARSAALLSAVPMDPIHDNFGCTRNKITYSVPHSFRAVASLW
jgi:hypothetical protein